jgi:hypothetical protein
MDIREISSNGWIGCNWFRVWVNAGINEHADKPLGFTKKTFFLLNPIRLFIC